MDRDLLVSVGVQAKKKLLLGNNIALWDVIASCSIKDSSDSSIKDVVANNLVQCIAWTVLSLKKHTKDTSWLHVMAQI